MKTTQSPKLYQKMIQAIRDGDALESQNCLKDILFLGYTIDDVLDHVILPTIDEINEKFHTEDFYITDVMLASRAINACFMDLDSFHTPRRKNFYDIKVVIGTVAGDIHTIGKTLITMVLQANGIQVIDLGIDVDGDKFIKAIEKYNPQIVMLSTLLTTTMPEMKKIITLIDKKNLRDSIKIMVGGGPVTQEYADDIGADGYKDTVDGIISWIIENREMLRSLNT